MDSVNFWDVVRNRRSIRRFHDKTPSMESVERIMEAALKAPSGKNRQNWFFKVIFDREVIREIASAIMEKNRKIADALTDEKADKFSRFAKYSTFFKDAPVLILGFAGPYDITGYAELIEAGMADEAEGLQLTAPGIQNLGAAFENLLLAAEASGLSGCWMTSPNYAAKEIMEVAGAVPEGYRLAAMTPLGFPMERTEGPEKKKRLSQGRICILI